MEAERLRAEGAEGAEGRMKVEAFEQLPPPTTKDRVMLALNLLPLALSAGFRALFWLFQVLNLKP